jgi:hypothetical protein
MFLTKAVCRRHHRQGARPDAIDEVETEERGSFSEIVTAASAAAAQPLWEILAKQEERTAAANALLSVQEDPDDPDRWLRSSAPDEDWEQLLSGTSLAPDDVDPETGGMSDTLFAELAGMPTAPGATAAARPRLRYTKHEHIQAFEGGSRRRDVDLPARDLVVPGDDDDEADDPHKPGAGSGYKTRKSVAATRPPPAAPLKDAKMRDPIHKGRPRHDADRSQQADLGAKIYEARRLGTCRTWPELAKDTGVSVSTLRRYRDAHEAQLAE